VSGAEIAWRPTPDYINHSRLKAFIDRHGLRDYNDLLGRSTTDLEWFWRAVLDELGIEFYEPFSQVLDTSRGIPWTRWCVGGRMNIVHNCLDKWMGTPVAERHAFRWETEGGESGHWTYAELWRSVNQCAAGLEAIGVRKGDRVALFMPMCPELIISFFAVIRLGAIVLPLFSGYGADAVATRLRDSEATTLITADGFLRRGVPVRMKPVADEAAGMAPSVQRVVVVPRLGIDIPNHQRDIRFADVVSPRGERANERTDAEDPLMLIYTSGTTGRPKGAVHTHCGFPIKTAQDMLHCFDVQPGETMYWVSDIGWMMGPWEIFGMTLLGGTFVIYDGALDYPGPDRLWSLVERHRVNIPWRHADAGALVDAHGEDPVRAHDLSSLRIPRLHG
jgi:acetyl-CoA synthetase